MTRPKFPPVARTFLHRGEATFPARGDAVKARCILTGRWMGGVVSTVDHALCFLTIVAGSYALGIPGDKEAGTRCHIAGITVFRGPRGHVKVFEQSYLDVDSVVYEEVLP